MHIDLWILDRVFEPLYRRIHRATGIGNYALAKWTLFISTALLVVLGFAGLAHSFKGSVWLWLEVFYVWPAMSAAVRLEREWTALVSPPNFRSPASLTIEWRIVLEREMLLMVPILLPFLYWLTDRFLPTDKLVHPAGEFIAACVLGWALLLTGFYFLACTPPPPRKKRQPEPGRMTAVPITVPTQ